MASLFSRAKSLIHQSRRPPEPSGDAKRLLVTSDDFGMSHSVNAGIEQALDAKVVRATNIMVPCPWSQDAVRRVKERGYRAGIHLTLTAEWEHLRWAPLTCAASLRAEDGGFARSYQDIPERVTDEEILSEYSAQLTELRRRGVEPTHVDTHMLASMAGGPMELRVKALVERFCERERLLYTYSTTEDGHLRHFASETMYSPMKREELEDILRSLGGGLHHIICHCALSTEEQRGITGPQGQDWAHNFRHKDHQTMTDPAFRALVEGLGFELVDMSALV